MQESTSFDNGISNVFLIGFYTLSHPPPLLSLSVALQSKLGPGCLILRFLDDIHLSPSVPKVILADRYSTQTKHFCKNILPMKSTDVTLVNIKITVLWDVMPWSMVHGFKHFSGMPSTPGTSVLRMDASRSTETLEPSYPTHSVTSLKITIPITSHSDSDDDIQTMFYASTRPVVQ
jgi:hypothetical protein